jgi:diguanylate cyclase (GGDEF)-like protein
MRLLAPHDGYLLAGLAAALAVVFAHPLNQLLDAAREVEHDYGLSLLPGLVILTVVFIFQQQLKRQKIREQADASDVQARVATSRARDLENLVTFGQALTRSLDMTALGEASAQYLPGLIGQDDAWIMIRTKGSWETLVGDTQDPEVIAGRERMAEGLFGPRFELRPRPSGIECDDEVCYPMLAAGSVVGVLGVPRNGVVTSESRRTIISAAAAVLAVSIKNAELFRDVRENSLRDSLTGLYNRAHTLEVIATELRRACRTRALLSIVMFDLDRFKQVNDRMGHQCGDAVLAAVGRRTRELLRASDVRCRYGGDEFLVVLPETPLEGARRVAEALRRALAENAVDWNGEAVTVTGSFGVALALPGETDPGDFVGRADIALYRAKNDGRNCVRIAAGAEILGRKPHVPAPAQPAELAATPDVPAIPHDAALT